MSTASGDSAQPVGQPIVPPSDFPVTWEDPDDVRLHWTRDRLHSPGQQTPLEVSMSRILMASLGNNRLKLINSYSYHANVGSPPDPNAQAAEEEKRLQEIQETLGRLEQVWQQEWLPQVQAHLAFWEEFDLAGASVPDLIQHLEETKSRFAQLWQLHFTIVRAAHGSVSFFDDLYQDLFGSENPFGAYALLEGFPNLTVEMGLALWRLSRKALAEPDVCTTIESTEASEVMEELAKLESGRRFLVDLHGYLQEHGQRSELAGLRNPSWIEEPAPVIQNLRDYIAQPDRDLQQDLETAAMRREARVAETRAQLEGYPQQVVDEFELLLKAAQAGTVIGEDHGYWLDFRSNYLVRCLFLEFGRRLVQAGVIEEIDDVFFLYLDELEETIATLPDIDRKDLVAKRKAVEERFAGIEAPPALGTLPPGPTPAPESAMSRAWIRCGGKEVEQDESPDLINGNAGSPGSVQGRVKVIHRLSDAGKLEPGDVLVAITTAPPWTPLFATAAAVVTDTGGVLSHCAVVAREYGIPAVVGTGSASAMLKDGQIVEVDGNAGKVRVIG